MSKIYRLSDRIKVKVDGLVVEISPLSLHQKAEIESDILTGSVESSMRGAANAVRYSVKDISGIEDASGNSYELEFDESGKALTQDCIDDLFNLPETQKLMLACLNLIKSIPDEFIDPNTGEAIQGVKIIKTQESSRKKKKAAARP